MSLPKLPPVRRRADYSDIGADDLTFALFYDKIGQDLATLDKATEPMIKKAFDAPAVWQGWATITKVDEERRIVYGIASTEDPDDQPGIFKGEQYAGDIVSSEAMRAAAPDYLEFPAIREMHGPSAAGTAVHFEIKGAQTLVGAHVVDDQAWAKVVNKVYRGFSIGGKMIDAEIVKIGGVPYRKITRLKLNEISLVDRPANPQARITLYKGADMDIDQGATDVADEQITKAADPTKAIGMLQELRNAAELEGDMDAADRYTDAIRATALGAGIATTVADDEDGDLSDDMSAGGLAMVDGDMDATEDPDATDDMAMGAKSGDVRKRGAELSAKNMAHAHTAHEALHKMTGGAVCRGGAVSAKDDTDQPSGPPLLFAGGLTGQDLTKALAPAFDGIAKVLEANGVQIAAMQQQIDQISRQAAPGGPALRAVEKSLPGAPAAPAAADPEIIKADMLREQLAAATDPTIQKYLSDQISRIEFKSIYK